MDLQCAVCSVNFDLDEHAPKCLPCGHTICKTCVENPALQRKCPTCKKGLGRNIHSLPDNFIVIQMLEQDSAPPRKRPRTEDTAVQQLQRGVDAGRKLVEQLRQVFPLAVEALTRQLDSSVAQLRQLEEALEQQLQPEGADAPLLGLKSEPLDLTEQLQLAAQLERSLRVLTTTKCSAVAEEEDGATWRASVQQVADVLRLLFLQLQTDGQLEKVDDVATPAAYVGPPMTTILRIKREDLDNGHLKVNNILRERKYLRYTRKLLNLRGEGSAQLLRVLGPQLEELAVDVKGIPLVLEEVQKMKCLRRLSVICEKGVNDYPTLPLHLEGLRLSRPSENLLRSVERMPALQSLTVTNYIGPDVNFAPLRSYGVLRWLNVIFEESRKATMLSLIHSNASSLQELRIYCCASDKTNEPCWYFPDLAQELAACGLLALRRLVLQRPRKSPCTDHFSACLLQRQSLRSLLPSSIEIICLSCNISDL